MIKAQTTGDAPMNINSSDLINLADFIQQLKADLKPIQDAPLFYIDSIEVEAHVVASLAQSGNAGIKISILNFGAQAGVDSKRETAYSQTVKIKLSPVFSKEELKNTLSPEKLNQAKQTASQTVMRGGGGGVKVKIRGE
jgi:hypothetical protein